MEATFLGGLPDFYQVIFLTCLTKNIRLFADFG
jgi:hypothetical protein